MDADRLTAVRRPLTGLALVASAYVVAFVIVYYATVHTQPGRHFGDAALRGALLTNRAVTGTVDAVLDVVSAASLVGAVAVVATVALVRLARLQGLAAIGLMVGANASTWLLKEVLLSRPDLGLDEVAPTTLNSMPSGHSTAVFSAVAALVFVLPPLWRPPTALFGAGVATLTGLATMSAGWHRAGDSMAAFLVVGFWTAAAAATVTLLGERREGRPGPTTRPALLRWLGVFAVGAVILGSAIALAMDAAPSLRDSAAGQVLDLVAAAVLISGTASGVVVGILVTLQLMESAA